MNTLLKEFINIESVSENEREFATYLKVLLENKGWIVKLQILEEYPEQMNVFAYRKNSNPRFLFCTHMDTVPPFFPASETEEYIYGRGSCDAKCHIVTMLNACEKLIKEGYDDLGVLFTVCEETDHRGVKESNKLNLTPEYLIVGEPTNLKMMILQKGCINGRIECFGKKVHSGYPDFGDCAVTKLVDILYELKHTELPKDDKLGKTTINYFIDNGGVASNVLNDYSSAQLCIRCPSDVDKIIEKLEKIVGEKGKLYIDAKTSPIKLEEVKGYDFNIASYVTDLAHFHSVETKKILLGAGDIFDAHTNTEKVKKEDLSKASEMYVNLVKKLY